MTRSEAKAIVQTLELIQIIDMIFIKIFKLTVQNSPYFITSKTKNHRY